jgi:hypothetical protein
MYTLYGLSVLGIANARSFVTHLRLLVLAPVRSLSSLAAVFALSRFLGALLGVPVFFFAPFPVAPGDCRPSFES